MKKSLSISCLFFMSIICLQAQIEFKQSMQELPSGSFTMGFADVNGDYRDDVVVQGEDRTVHLLLQTQNKDFVATSPIRLQGGNDWSLSILDMDNDGKKEIITSGYYDGTRLIKFLNTVDFSSTVETIEAGEIFAQNSNAIDINKDGLLDYFVCNDDGDSRMYLNDGAGNFYYDNSMFNFDTNPVSDGSGNYGSIWADIDGDDDLDLYIAKCRSFATSDQDPRRINQLHINNGDGTFTESAGDFGLASGEQTWAADFADADNDGDLDCYMVEHTGNYMLYENVDNYFYPKQDYISQAIQGNGFQGFFSDFDNDGLVDIIIAGDSDYILWNKGALNFDREDLVIPGNSEIASLALGDANMDGFTDLLTTFSAGFNISGIPNNIQINQGNDNHYVKISLQGVESNREGVGAKIKVYSALGTQMRNVTCGEGYGIVNSVTQSYGLGQDQVIDSLITMWPSGQIDTYYNLDVNHHYIIHEGSCISSLDRGNYEDFVDVFCEGDSTQIVSDGYTWNSGTMGSSVNVSSTGFYYASILDDQDCNSPMHTVFIQQEPEIEAAILADSEIACRGDQVTLSSGFDEGVVWSTQEETPDITVNTSGVYYYTVSGNCSQVESPSIELVFLDPADIEDQTIEADQGDDVEVTVEGENVHWFMPDDLENSFHQGNVLNIEAIESSRELRVQDIPGQEVVTDNVGLTDIFEGMNGETVNAGLYFTVINKVLIKGVTVNTDDLGLRTIEVRDELGNVIQSKDVEIITTGEQFVSLDFIIQPGENYYMTTNTETNTNTFGTASPRFFRNTNVTGFPFISPEFLIITESFFGSDYYYYFYDWELSNLAVQCPGNIATVEIDVELSNVNDPDLLADLAVFPIPSSDVINIESENYKLKAVELYDAQGKLTFMQEIPPFQANIDVVNLAPGIYVLKIITDSGKNAFIKIPCINR